MAKIHKNRSCCEKSVSLALDCLRTKSGMWLWLTVCSAVLLGFYDITKKQALKRNGVLWILLCSTSLTALFLCPFLSAGSIGDHLRLLVKACLVSASWISGLVAMKLLPLTTASTMKASRPMFVVVFSIILFGERLNLLQWAGVILVIGALYFLGRSSRKEGIRFTRSKGVVWMALSIVTGAASALYDKYILTSMQPLFVQSWANVYITVVLAVVMLVSYLHDKSSVGKLKPDWTLLLIAVLITISDALYFFAVKQDGALLSVISMIRRSSVIITFIGGALIFRENNIRDKALDLGIMLAGLALLLFAS